MGGGLSNTFLKAQGYEIGVSLSEDALLSKARWMVGRVPLVLPDDVVVADEQNANPRVVAIDPAQKNICAPHERIVDIGPKTQSRYADVVRHGATILWNGPMGYYEHPPFNRGTIAIAKAIPTHSHRTSIRVAGGGETIDAITKAKAAKKFTWISSGGGAMLLFFGQKPLPALLPLAKTRR